MPKIRVFETDNTGSTSSDLAGVFVPGTAELVDGVADANNCVYIPSTATDLSKYFKDYDYDSVYDALEGNNYTMLNVVHEVDLLLGMGYGVVYMYVPDVEEEVEVATATDDVIYLEVVDEDMSQAVIDEGLYTFYKYSESVDDYVVTTEYISGNKYYIAETVYDTKTGAQTVSGLSRIDWDCLNDKNAYDLKFITVGTYGAVQVANKSDTDISVKKVKYVQVVSAGESYVTSDDFTTLSSSVEFYKIEEDSSGNETYVIAEEYESETNYYIKSYITETDKDSSTTVTDDQGTSYYTFDFTNANLLTPVCGSRKDCSLLVDLNYYNILYGYKDITGNTILGSSINGNNLASDFKIALEYDEGDTKSTFLKSTVSSESGEMVTLYLGSRSYALIPNATMSYTTGSTSLNLTVPSSFVYLSMYANNNKKATTWLPITGVTRGVVGDTFTPDLDISKYYVDNNVITDTEGVSFNVIVSVRSYGYTIWGDRTLLEQTANKGIQATSYFSIRNLISDVARKFYDSAIKYTYETNNDVTWTNFKTPIVSLLDQMVSSGVLQSYKVKKRTADTVNKIIAVITLKPVAPVEDFDLYLDIEDAEVTASVDDE